MLRQLHRHSIWQNAQLPPVGVAVNQTHPRAKNLLGCWVPHAPGLYGSVYTPNGSAPVKMRDLSVHRRDGQFNRGPNTNQTDGKWVVDRAGPGFYLPAASGYTGQYGRFDVAPTRSADWDFPGALTWMCRIRLNTLASADASQRTFLGRSDGAGPLFSTWFWAWGEQADKAAAHRIYVWENTGGGSSAVAASTVAWDPTATDIYTVAVTRNSAADTWRFYVDGVQLGDAVVSAFTLPPPGSTTMWWGHGVDFGYMLLGTFFWMKAWERELSPREVLAEHVSPWDMLRFPLGSGSVAAEIWQRAYGLIM